MSDEPAQPESAPADKSDLDLKGETLSKPFQYSILTLMLFLMGVGLCLGGILLVILLPDMADFLGFLFFLGSIFFLILFFLYYKYIPKFIYVSLVLGVPCFIICLYIAFEIWLIKFTYFGAIVTLTFCSLSTLPAILSIVRCKKQTGSWWPRKWGRVKEKTDTANKDPKRRWYQYSLRSLMIVMVLFCFLFAWVGYKVRKAEKQRNVVIWVEELGGWVNAEPRNYFSDITVVGLSVTQVKDLSPLKDLTNLKNLWLNGTQVSDFSPLEGLTNLEGLWLFDTRVTDLSPLKGLTKLKGLDLHGTQVKDLSPLNSLANLYFLSLKGTQVSDLSPLKKLTNLHNLKLNGTQVSDLSPLTDLKNLERLDLSSSEVTDLSPLEGLTNLEELDLRATQVSKEEVQKLRNALPSCAIEWDGE